MAARVPRCYNPAPEDRAGVCVLGILMDFVEGLNPRQREAVLTTEGPVLVLAGAGSGKTQAVTRRIAHIIANRLAAPEQVLAVTFTNKAAGEMRERVGGLIGKDAAKRVCISTFHSYCLKVLREHIEQLGYRKNFSIAGEGDVRTLLRRVVDDLNHADKRYSPSEFQAAISLFKNTQPEREAPKAGPIEKESQEKYAETLPDVIAAYQSALRAANSVDFDDLLSLTLKLWREFPAVHRACQEEFRYVMVDEYQDTNKVQFDLVRMLVEGHRNLCVVGDDDQSIYRWRGADPRMILDFDKHYPGAKVVTLDQNYRSTNTILRAANGVIKNNTERREKTLWSELGEGRVLDHFLVADEEAEAAQAVEWLKHIHAKTGGKFSDFALLYRSNLQSKPLELAFRTAGIPYVVIGGQDFFERAEVRDIVSYLKIIANPRDEAAFLRVVNMPKRGIGDVTLHAVHELCRTERVSLAKGMAEALKRGDTPDQAKKGIREFLDLLMTFRERFKQPGASLKGVVEDLVIAIDYRGELERAAKNREQAHNRWLNVESVIEAVGAYEAAAEKPSLTDFLDKSHLNTDDAAFTKQERRASGVTLMTIHSAKGLEFPYVFVMGCEEGLLPHGKSVLEGGLEEERRLFYVALTRGKRYVALFEALLRKRGENERPTETSRFLKEIPQELLKPQVKASRDMLAQHLPPTPPKKKKPAAKPRAKKP